MLPLTIAMRIIHTITGTIIVFQPAADNNHWTAPVASQTQAVDGKPIVRNAIVWSQIVESVLHRARII